MFESMSRGWALTKTSFRVLATDKHILVLPVLSGLALLALVASLLVPLSLIGLNPNNPLTWVGLFGFYVVTYFVALSFNAAVIEMATMRFNGVTPTLKDGLGKAWARKWRILQWAVVAATVGLILKVLENMARQNDSPMARMLGQVGVWIAGAAWHVASFFAMPVLIYRDVGPFQALRESVATWKGRWGEGFAAIMSTGMIFLLLGLIGVVPAYLGLVSGSAVLATIGVGVAVVYGIGLWVANTAVDGIIVAALYKYAVDGELPEAFQDAPVDAPQRITPYA